METSSKTTTAWEKFVQFPLTRIGIAFFMVIVPFILTQALVAALPLSDIWSNILVMCLAAPVVLGMYSLYVHWLEHRPVTELASVGALKETGQGFLLGAALFSLTIGVLAVLGVYKVTGITSLDALILPLAVSVLTGVFEEVIMRGVLFRIVENSLGTWLALIISATVFGLLHLLNANATLVGALSLILEAGILLAAAYMFTHRLWLAIGIHIAWNFTQAGIYGVVVSGNTFVPGLLRASLDGPAWLSGGAFGAEASFVAVIVCLAAGVYLVAQAVKKGNIIQPFWQRNNQ